MVQEAPQGVAGITFFKDGKEVVTQEIFKKYLAYARQTVKPRIQSIDEHRLTSIYADLRRESMISGVFTAHHAVWTWQVAHAMAVTQAVSPSPCATSSR